MGTTAGGRGLARSLPSLECIEGVGKAVPQVCGKRQGRQHSPAERQSQGQDFVERTRRRRIEPSTSQGSEQIDSRVAVRQALWEKHLQNPRSALEEALRRTAAGGGRAESSAAGGIRT